jgi:hypothetical protein
VKSRNVRLGICIEGFNPFGSFATPYSCWPIILMVYNLSPRMCMRPKFMFLSMVIPDLNSLYQKIDVCLHLLIDEFKQLWSSKALTNDASRKYKFQMKANLMWIINDFLVYGMISSTYRKLAYSYCIENKKMPSRQ